MEWARSFFSYRTQIMIAQKPPHFINVHVEDIYIKSILFKTKTKYNEKN